MDQVVLPDITSADIIRQLLIDLNVVKFPQGSVEWPAFVEMTPDQPDNCITLYDTTGTLNGRHMVGGEVQLNAGLMVKIRSTNDPNQPIYQGHRLGFKKINQIIKALNEQVCRNMVTIVDPGVGSHNYLVHSANQQSDVMKSGRTPMEGNRYVFTVNYTIAVDYIP